MARTWITFRARANSFCRFLSSMAAAVVLLTPTIANSQVTVEERFAPGEKPIITAQRALGGGAPENSLAGIEHAVTIGVDMVKIDVQLTADGRHILMHDRTLDRTTNAEDVFSEHPYVIGYRTLEEIKRLRLRGGTDGDEHPIPTLEEALDVAGDRILVAIGLHTYDLKGLARLLDQRNKNNLLLFFPEPSDTMPLKEAIEATGLKVFVGLSRSGNYKHNLERLAEALGSNLAMIGMARGGYTPDVVARAAELNVNLSIAGFGPPDHAMRAGDPSSWEELLGIGAAAFLTTEPDEVVKLLGR